MFCFAAVIPIPAQSFRNQQDGALRNAELKSTISTKAPQQRVEPRSEKFKKQQKRQGKNNLPDVTFISTLIEKYIETSRVGSS